METQEIKKRGRKKIAKLPEEKKEEIVTEPKKRGRKKKESNELIQQIQDMKIEDFQMQEKEETVLFNPSKEGSDTSMVTNGPSTYTLSEGDQNNKPLKNEIALTKTVEEITKGIESIMIEEEEDKERDEKREIKSKRIKRVIGEPKSQTYYLYLYKRRLESVNEKGMYYEYDKEKIEKTIFIYQVIVYGSYENDMILYPTERDDLIHEDEIEIIKGHQMIRIRILPERSLKKFQREIEQDKWKVLMLRYRMPKIGRVTDREICEKILKKDEMFVGSEKRAIDNIEILNRNLFYFESDSLILSTLTLKDIFEEFAKME